MMRLLSLLLLVASAARCFGKFVEWPVTLQNDIHTSANDVGIGSKHLNPVDPPLHSAGYLELNNTVDAKLFYFYAEERNKIPDTPVILWTNGGPGCSSVNIAFSGLGPFVVTEHLSLEWSKYGWDRGQNIIFLDQPVGTGFSKTSDERDYVRYEDRVGQDGLFFLLEFMSLHPELHDRDLYLAGVSYAGHFLPAMAHAIHQSNQRGKHMHLKLKGVLLGNPAISEVYLNFYYPHFAYMHNLISRTFASALMMHAGVCQAMSVKCNRLKTRRACVRGYNYCQRTMFAPILEVNPDLDIYNIETRCIGDECYGVDYVGMYLNSPKVQAQLGVDRKWKDCNNKVFKHMLGDQLIDSAPTVVGLLNEGIRFLVYSGEFDLICNWVANTALLNDMVWRKSDQWTGKFKPWSINRGGKLETVGECETVEPLTNCKIFDSGHSVDFDVPQVGYAAMRTFIHGGIFVPSDAPKAVTGPQENSQEVLKVN